MSNETQELIDRARKLRLIQAQRIAQLEATLRRSMELVEYTKKIMAKDPYKASEVLSSAQEPRMLQTTEEGT